MNKIESSKLHTFKNAGFTLVELVVSMTLTAIFATALVAIMPSAARIFMQVEDMSRAQVVADMVVDALREECADTYIDDITSVRIIQTEPSSDGDADLLDIFATETFKNSPLRSDETGNVLIIRKSDGYCETIYSCINISKSNYQSVKSEDKSPRYEHGISSRAVYRFFQGDNIAEETNQGYVHYGYYSCGSIEKTENDQSIRCIFPAIRYDYTVPFSNGAYNGYTVDISFSNLEYTLAPEASDNTLFNQRPSSVQVTVQVYRCSYEDQNSTTPIYTRKAILVFKEDTSI